MGEGKNRCGLAVETALRLAGEECKDPSEILKEIAFIFGISKEDVEKPEEILKKGIPDNPYAYYAVSRLVAAKVYEKLKKRRETLPEAITEAWREVKEKYGEKFQRPL